MAQVEARGVWDAEVVGSSPITPTDWALRRQSGGTGLVGRIFALLAATASNDEKTNPPQQGEPCRGGSCCIHTASYAARAEPPTPPRLRAKAFSMDRKAARCTPHRHYPLSLYTLAMFPRLPAYAAVPSRPRRHDCAGSQSGTTSRTVGPLVVI